MTACCPTCQREFTTDARGGIVVANRLVSRNGLTVKLARREMAVFNCLHAANGRIVERDTLMAAVYGDDNDDPDWHILSVFISKIRSQVKPLGIFIVVQYGIGWAMGVER